MANAILPDQARLSRPSASGTYFRLDAVSPILFAVRRRGILVLGPDFRKLFAASAASNLGDGIVYTAAPLLAATLTRDPLLVAAVMFMRSVPWLLFSLVSGALIDRRLDRRKVMGAFNSLRAAAIGFLSLAVLLGFANLPLLYAVFFIIGTCETFFDNASQTILPAVVSREDFEKANGRLEGARIVTNDLAGPSLGGLLFGVSAAIPFLLNAARSPGPRLSYWPSRATSASARQPPRQARSWRT
jgi:hypothetical protein